MNPANLPLFSLLSQRMGWLSERHRVLSENVANVDTPNYKARDIKEPDFAALASKASARLGPAVTDPRHMEARTTSSRTVMTKDGKAESTLSGNTVSIESELKKVADTAMDYQLITNLYRKQIGMLRAVIGRPQG
jgi:flagellar basal-body rod protein FlgB